VADCGAMLATGDCIHGGMKPRAGDSSCRLPPLDGQLFVYTVSHKQCMKRRGWDGVVSALRDELSSSVRATYLVASTPMNALWHRQPALALLPADKTSESAES
jgi:hypothetical protein